MLFVSQSSRKPTVEVPDNMEDGLGPLNPHWNGSVPRSPRNAGSRPEVDWFAPAPHVIPIRQRAFAYHPSSPVGKEDQTVHGSLQEVASQEVASGGRIASPTEEPRVSKTTEKSSNTEAPTSRRALPLVNYIKSLAP